MNRPTDQQPDMDTDGLVLFVTGDSPRSRRARANLSRALERSGGDTVDVREIDLFADPTASARHAIFATPALMRVHGGEQTALLYGDLSDGTALERFLTERPDQPASSSTPRGHRRTLDSHGR
ncbi:MAG: circadian clock KaiB family protein [Halofilum sp. (in: g-proteobacteria)]